MLTSKSPQRIKAKTLLLGFIQGMEEGGAPRDIPALSIHSHLSFPSPTPRKTSKLFKSGSRTVHRAVLHLILKSQESNYTYTNNMLHTSIHTQTHTCTQTLITCYTLPYTHKLIYYMYTYTNNMLHTSIHTQTHTLHVHIH